MPDTLAACDDVAGTGQSEFGKVGGLGRDASVEEGSMKSIFYDELNTKNQQTIIYIAQTTNVNITNNIQNN